MRDLALVGMSEDLTHLIARDAVSGEEFHIRADHRARSLIDALSQTGKSDNGQLEIKMEIALSPRDIQTRIRRGESPEAVADAAGVEVDRIMAYAVPVLAERDFVCEQARKTVIRRKFIDGASVVFGPLVDEQLLARGGSPEAADWDAWKREDGRWAVHVTPEGANEPATFLFDVPGRYVLPAGQLAHDLVGDVPLPNTADMAIADAVRSPADEQADVPAAAEPHPQGVASLKAARDRRAMGQLVLGDDADDARASRQDSSGPRHVDAPAVPPQSLFVDDYGSYDMDLGGHDIAVPDMGSHPSQQPRKKRHERRRVPSWDEIMFGGKPESE